MLLIAAVFFTRGNLNVHEVATNNNRCKYFKSYISAYSTFHYDYKKSKNENEPRRQIPTKYMIMHNIN